MRRPARQDRRGRKLWWTGRGLLRYCRAVRGDGARHRCLGGVLRAMG